MIKLSELLHEGYKDPGIFKAVFLAGGPGSGKTYIAKGLFGIPEKVNVSQSGLKMVNSDKELKFLLNKYGFGTNLDALPDEVFSNLTNPNDPQYSGLRDFAKDLTGQRRKLYQDGRLGMIIDGTGDDFRKIAAEKKELEKIGYDCYMIFVNTSLDIAQERNMQRKRKLQPKAVEAMWNAVQRNIGGFQRVFGTRNFIIVDNNENISDGDLFAECTKRIRGLVKGKPTKPQAKAWIANELRKKDRTR